MILKTLKAKNIRSIKDFQLEFPESTMLFHGDIGSGKSSVLKAIEFALFGTLRRDLEGDSLLRRGEQSAFAELTFLIGEKEYTIHRELKIYTKKGETRVSQPSGWLIENGVKTSYTTRELRRKILTILNYSVPRYEQKGSIDIFRYTVYTPQEDIKFILQADPKERFEILKNVLEIEKYENTLINLEIIRPDINVLIKDKETILRSIGKPEEKIPEKEKEISTKKTQIVEIKNEIDIKNIELEKENKNLEEIRKELNDYSSKIQEIDAVQRQIEKDSNSTEENKKQLLEIREEIEKSEKDLSKLPIIELKTNQSEEQLEQSLQELRKFSSDMTEKKAVLREKIKNTEKLLKEGICSFCDQKIYEKDRFDKELEKTKSTIQDLTEEIEKHSKEIEIKKGYKKNVRAFNDNEKEKRSKNKIIDQQKLREKDLKTILVKLEKNIKENRLVIKEILKSYEITDLKEFKELEGEINEKLERQKSAVYNIQEKAKSVEKKLIKYELELTSLEKELEKLMKDLQLKKNIEKTIKYIREVKDWIGDKFQGLLKDIERMVLSTTASHFNRYFKEWFKEMVEEENIDIQVNPENFNPIIMVNGYESPVRDLSGGEKSALSLAYRLALNKVINTKHQEVKTKDLLILDEPTDGFSQQQINKMQDIFEKLDTKQMIIISHESTLESFVTDIFNFKKINHVTTVDREN